MKISTQYNRFLHGVVLKQAYNQADEIMFSQWQDTDTGGILTFRKGLDYSDLDDLKQIFKLLNIHYPIDGDIKLSTTKADSVTIMRQIDFVIRTMGENSIPLQFVEDEWKLLLAQAGIGE